MKMDFFINSEGSLGPVLCQRCPKVILIVPIFQFFKIQSFKPGKGVPCKILFVVNDFRFMKNFLFPKNICQSFFPLSVAVVASHEPSTLGY
jgi:hypothetical protein